MDGGGPSLPRGNNFLRQNASSRNHKQPQLLPPRPITSRMALLFRNTLRATAAASSFHATPRLITRPAAFSAFPKASFAARPVFAQSRVAAFHTSQSLGILPAGPRRSIWVVRTVTRGIVLLTWLGCDDRDHRGNWYILFLVSEAWVRDKGYGTD